MCARPLPPRLQAPCRLGTRSHPHYGWHLQHLGTGPPAFRVGSSGIWLVRKYILSPSRLLTLSIAAVYRAESRTIGEGDPTDDLPPGRKIGALNGRGDVLRLLTLTKRLRRVTWLLQVATSLRDGDPCAGRRY